MVTEHSGSGRFASVRFSQGDSSANQTAPPPATMVGPLQPKRSGCLLFQSNGAREQDVVLKVDVLVQVSLEVLQRGEQSVVS